MFQRTQEHALLESYLGEKVLHVYERVGYEPSEDGDTYFDVLLRELSVGLLCGFGLQDCVDNVESEFGQWMSAPDPDAEGSNPIDAGIRTTAYCTAISSGGAEEWNFLQERYFSSQNANEKKDILYALGCSQDEQTLRRCAPNILEAIYMQCTNFQPQLLGHESGARLWYPEAGRAVRR